MIDKIPLNALKYFYYAASFGSITIASQKLHVTQSAVSKQIKKLEDTLQFDLFNRVNRSLQLTPKGQTLYESCQSVFAQLDNCLLELQPQNTTNQLVLSCEPTISIRWLIPRLAEFKALNYGFEVILLTAGGMINMHQSRVDLALRRNDFAWGEHIYHEKIIDEYMLVVKSNQHADNKTLLLTSSRPKLWKQLRKSGILTTELLTYERMPLEHFYLCIEGCLAGLGTTVASIYMLEKMLTYQLLEPINTPVADGSAYHLLSAEPFNEDDRKVVFKTWLQEEMTKTRDALLRSVFKP